MLVTLALHWLWLQGSCTPGDLETFGGGTPGAKGVPFLGAAGAPLPGYPFRLTLEGGAPGAAGVLAVGGSEQALSLAPFGAVFYPAPPLILIAFTTDTSGASPAIAELSPVSASFCGANVVAQAAVVDAAASGGASFTQGLRVAFGAPQGGPLFPAPGFATDEVPVRIAAGDLNEDGVLDLATANFSTSAENVSVLLGVGDGTFAVGPAVPITGPFSGANLRPIALADLDSDHHLDLLVAGGPDIFPGKLHVALGLGDGTFAPPATYNLGINPFNLEVADFDGDGDLDVACLNGGSSIDGGSSSLRIMQNPGTGALQYGQVVDLPSIGAYAHGLASGDLNEDGAVDLVVTRVWTSQPGILLALLGAGDGTFALGGSAVTETYPGHAVLADVDGDGHLDAVVSNLFSDSVVWLRGDGAGAFAAAEQLATVPRPGRMAWSNLDRDSDQDLVVLGESSPNSGIVTVLLAEGGGAFAPAATYAIGASVDDLVALDLDGDGSEDLALVNTPADEIIALLGVGDGTVSVPWSVGTDPDPLAMALDDFDQDGDLDAAVAHAPGHTRETISIFDGQGGIELEQGQKLDSGLRLRDVATCDLDGDGWPDLVAVNSDADEIHVHLGGPGGFGAATAYATGDQPFGVACADVDLDGALDALSANRGADTVSLHLGTGAGTLLPPSAFAVGDGPGPIDAGDLDLDGVPDAVVGTAGPLPSFLDDTLTILYGAGGGLGSPQTLLNVYNPGDVRITHVQDDGVPDIAVSTWTAVVFEGLGGKAYARTDLPNPALMAWSIVVGDADGDALADVLLGTDSRVMLYSGIEGGGFGPPAYFNCAGNGFRALHLADLDGDLQPEILGLDKASDSLTVLANRLLAP